MSVYSGDIEVNDNDFYMKFERFIVRDKELSFNILGDDEFGDFTLEGVATKLPNGEYRADTKVIYSSYKSNKEDDQSTVSIIIDSVVESSNQASCLVKGRWLENQDTWKFQGEIEKFSKVQIQ